jgi:undecaprenyl-diphosphatase
MISRGALTFRRFDAAEISFCRYLNRSSRSTVVRQLFRAVSWLGDGWIWYALIASMPVFYGSGGMLAAVHTAATGLVALTLYKYIKSRAVRERPYITYSAIECASAPLDRYSFPSGHTLHATCFTVLMTAYFPAWATALVALTVLIALSRVILGLHYPTDVAAGAVLGGAIGFASSMATEVPLFLLSG